VVLVGTEAAAFTVPAPEAEKFAALRVTLATPLASVNAVPAAGEKVPNVAAVVNVTTTPTIGVVPDRIVALTLAGLPNAIDVLAVVAESSVRASTMVGVPVVVEP
jgi:hypothetical protein